MLERRLVATTNVAVNCVNVCCGYLDWQVEREREAGVVFWRQGSLFSI